MIAYITLMIKAEVSSEKKKTRETEREREREREREMLLILARNVYCLQYISELLEILICYNDYLECCLQTIIHLDSEHKM